MVVSWRTSGLQRSRSPISRNRSRSKAGYRRRRPRSESCSMRTTSTSVSSSTTTPKKSWRISVNEMPCSVRMTGSCGSWTRSWTVGPGTSSRSTQPASWATASYAPVEAAVALGLGTEVVPVVAVRTRRGTGSGRHVPRCVPMAGPQRSGSRFVP